MTNASDIRIIIVGKTGSGKSTTGNVLAGVSNKEGFKAGTDWNAITQKCESKRFLHENKLVSIVDVPGFLYVKISTEEMREEFSRCIEMTTPGIHALLFTIRVGRYKKEDMTAMEQFLQHFGNDAKDYVIIVFTGKDDLDEENKSTEECLATVPDNLKEFLIKIKWRFIFTNNRGTSDEKEHFKRKLITKIDEMVKANGSRCYTNDMYRLAADRMRSAEEKRKREEDMKWRREQLGRIIDIGSSTLNLVKNVAVGAVGVVAVVGGGVGIVVLGIAALYSRIR